MSAKKANTKGTTMTTDITPKITGAPSKPDPYISSIAGVVALTSLNGDVAYGHLTVDEDGAVRWVGKSE
jgi:hypothetical protein